MELNDVISGVTDFLDDVIAICDGHDADRGALRVRWCNAAFHRETGFCVDTHPGFPAGLDETDTPGIAKALSNALASGSPFRQDVKLARRDGSAFWVDLSVRPVCGHAAPSYWVCSARDITMRKGRDDPCLSELAALRKREAHHLARISAGEKRLRTVLETSDIGIWDFDVNTGEVWRSSEADKHGVVALKSLGYPDETGHFSWKEWRSIVHPGDLLAVNKAVADHLKGRTRLYSSEYRVRAQNGTYRWVHSKGLITDRCEDGRALRMMGCIADITDRKLDLEQLARALAAAEDAQQKQNQFGAIIEESLHEIYILDPASLRFRMANLGARRNLGYMEGEIKNLEPEDIHNDITLGQFKVLTAPLLSDEKNIISYECYNRRKDGSVYPVEVTVSLHKAQSASVFVMFVSDITEQVEKDMALTVALADAQAARQDAEALSKRLELATSAGGIGVWEYNIDQDKLIWDDGMLALYGIGREDLRGTLDDWRERIHPHDREAAEAAVLASMSSGEDLAFDYRIVRPDGLIRHIRANAGVSDDRGRRLMIGVNYDATALVAARERAERAKEHAQAEKWKAENASRAKSEFLANMSHELRTPMNGVIGMLDILAKTDLDEDRSSKIRTALESAQSLLRVLNDILDYSKLEAGEIEIEAIAFDPRHELDTVVNMLSYRAQERDLMIEVDADDTIPSHLIGDPTRLRQVLINLIGNAIKFTQVGGVRVSMSWDSGTHMLHTRVKDTGAGMSQEIQDRIFERFHQADASTTRKFGGTGLGLAISKQLVNRMGGEIAVESELGVGSVFSFSIAAKEGSAPAVAAVAEPQQQERIIVRPLRILVAEDHPTNQLVLKGFLQAAGHDLVMVDNGEQAVAAVQGGNYDLVLMDVQMPVMDGPTATRAIRALNGPVRQIPIIAVTANAMSGDREGYLAAGMNDYISKPIDLKVLLRTIARVAETAKTTASAG